jgi:hypothetical protein
MARAPKHKNLKPTGKCIFCGVRNVSKEHLWSQWTHDLLVDVKHLTRAQFEARALVDVRGSQHVIRKTPNKLRQGSTLTTKIRAVCRNCNNGWMSSSVEDVARLVMTSMIRGEHAVLTPPQQKAIATWIALKAMVGEYSQPNSKAIPDHEHHFLKANLCPPPSWQIFIARYQGKRWRAEYYHEGFTVGDSASYQPKAADGSPVRNIQTTLFGVGDLLVHAISSAIPELAFEAQDPIAHGMLRVWPVGSSDIMWPPAVTITDDKAEAIAEGMAQALWNSGLIFNPDMR